MLGYIAYPNVGPARCALGKRRGLGGHRITSPSCARATRRASLRMSPSRPFVIACARHCHRTAVPQEQSIGVGIARHHCIHPHARRLAVSACPEIMEVRRNASWLAMATAILIGVAAMQIPRRVPRRHGALLVASGSSPSRSSGAHEKLIELLRLQRDRVCGPRDRSASSSRSPGRSSRYGQEFPMVLGRGFHLAAADFLDRSIPRDAQAARFRRRTSSSPSRRTRIASRSTPGPRASTAPTLEQRLQTWCLLYQLNHRDMRVFLDDENVRVYDDRAADARTLVTASTLMRSDPTCTSPPSSPHTTSAAELGRRAARRCRRSSRRSSSSTTLRRDDTGRGRRALRAARSAHPRRASRTQPAASAARWSPDSAKRSNPARTSS